MSMIIDRVGRTAASVAVVLAAWIAVLLALPFAGESGRQVAIVGDPEIVVPLVAAAGGQLLDSRGGVTLARSDRPGFAAALYREGASLVVEGRFAAGCIRS